MNKYIFIILGIALSASAAITTAPKPGSPGADGNRFLFVVDTSSAMERIEHSGRQVVFDLVYSAVEGRMQPGDTFGVWTFASEVKAGVFPVKLWDAQKSSELAGDVGRFLKEQANGGKSQVDVAIAKVESLVRSVRDVDIIIVTSAAARFKEDETWGPLQQAWKSRLDEAKRTKKALIIALAARSGRIAQATVTLQGERLQLAAPPERKPPQVTTRKSSSAPVRKVAREPIIIRGSSKARPIEEIPTQFSPPPSLVPTEPAPVPVPTKPGIAEPKADPVLEIIPRATPVHARAPSSASVSRPSRSAVSARTLIMAGGALMLIAGVLGGWMLVSARSRSRVSYISQSMANKSPNP